MRAPWNKLASVSLAASLAATAMLSQIGCEGDQEKASKEVRAVVDAPPKEGADAVAEGNKAVNIKGGSPDVNIIALEKLAQAEVAKAAGLINRIERDEVRVALHLGAINRVAARVAGNNTLALGYRRLEPTDARAAVDAEKKKATDGTDGVWFPHESGALPAMKATDAQIAELQGKIQSLEGQIADLTAKRQQGIAEAERLETQADTQSGKRAVATFEQSANARKQAMEVAAQVAQHSSELLPLQQDLARAQETKKLMTAALASFDQLAAANDAKWQEAEASIKQLTELSRTLVEGGAGGGAGAPAAPVEAPTRPSGNSPPPADGPTPGPGASAHRTNGLVKLVLQAEPAAPADAVPAPAGATPAAAPAPADADPDAGPAATVSGAGGRPTLPMDPQLPASIAENAAEIKKLAATIAGNRTEAESLLKSALDHYTQAIDAASKLSAELNTKLRGSTGGELAEAAAWKGQLAMTNPSSLKLRQAGVQLLLARLHRSTAAEFAGRSAALKTVEAVVKEATLAGVPADLNDPAIADAGQAAREAATAAHEEAKKLIDDAEQASPPPGAEETVKVDARIAHVRRLVAMMSEAAVAGIPVSDDPAAHKASSDKAAQLLKAAQARAKSADAPVAAAELPGSLQQSLDLIEAVALRGAPGAATAPTAAAVTPGAATPTAATAGPAVPDSPEAAAARAAAVAFINALAKKDVEGAKALAAFVPPQDQYIEAQSVMISALKPFQDAMLAKFGTDVTVKAAMAALPDPMAIVRTSPIVVSGDAATISLPGATADDAMVVKKQADGTWKVTISETTEKIAREAPMLRATGAAWEKTTAGLNAGTYATPADALKDAVPASVLDDGAGAGTPTPPAAPAPTDPAAPAPAAPADPAAPAAPSDPAAPAPAAPQ